MTDPSSSPPSDGRGMMAAMERESSRDRLERDAFISLVVASRTFDEQVDQVCRNAGISHPQYTVLWVLCLADAPEGLPMGALADGLLTRSADTTRLVDRLVAAGLVARDPSPDDRRVVLVAPTAAGRTLFERLTSEVKALHRRQWGTLRTEELGELTHLLNEARLAGDAGPPST